MWSAAIPTPAFPRGGLAFSPAGPRAVSRAQSGNDGLAAIASRRKAGELGDVVRTPTDAVVLRFPFGLCRVAMDTGEGWQHGGEAAAGFVHASAPGAAVRTEWLHDGEELIVTVPHAYWQGRVSQRMRAILLRGRPRRHEDAALQQLTRLLLQAAIDGADDAFTAPLINALLERLLLVGADDVVRKLPSRCHQALAPHRMAKVTRYVREHLSEPVTLSGMAAAAGMSPMHFAAQFRAATGKRPHHFLLEERIERAKTWMADTNWSLCQIAIAAGFATQAHFCTVFKRYVGTTPKHWRDRRSMQAA